MPGTVASVPLAFLQVILMAPKENFTNDDTKVLERLTFLTYQSTLTFREVINFAENHRAHWEWSQDLSPWALPWQFAELVTVTLCLREDRRVMTSKSVPCPRAHTTYLIIPCFCVFFTKILMPFETHLANPSIAQWKRRTGKNLAEDSSQNTNSWETNLIFLVSSLIFHPPHFLKGFERAIYWKFVRGLHCGCYIFIGFLLWKGKTKVHSVQRTFLKWEASESQK